jgi:hypothetical protein
VLDLPIRLSALNLLRRLVDERGVALLNRPCPGAMEACREERPPRSDLGHGHRVRCWAHLDDARGRKRR